MVISFHISSVLVLFLLALLSITFAVLTAVKTSVDETNERLYKISIAIWMVEILSAVLVSISGLIAMYMGDWPFSRFWVWASLLTMVFYAVSLYFVTKPPIQSLAGGGNAVKLGIQVFMHFGYMLLIAFLFALMLFKPF